MTSDVKGRGHVPRAGMEVREDPLLSVSLGLSARGRLQVREGAMQSWELCEPASAPPLQRTPLGSKFLWGGWISQHHLPQLVTRL